MVDLETDLHKLADKGWDLGSIGRKLHSLALTSFPCSVDWSVSRNSLMMVTILGSIAARQSALMKVK